MKEEFNGSGLLIWYADGKLKYRTHDSQEDMDNDYKRLLERIPERCVIMMAINWDEQDVMFIKELAEEHKN